MARAFALYNFGDFCELNQSPEVGRFVNHNGGKPKTYSECVEKYNDITYAQNKFGYSYWAIYDSSGKNFLGQCGAMKAWVSDVNTFCYAFRKKYWGRGIGTEVCSITMNYLLENFPSLDILSTSVIRDNVASIKIIRKLGFEYLHSEKEFGKDLDFFEFKRANYVQKSI
jgi:ribosomal-protein-alanine N-acetyltransferase